MLYLQRKPKRNCYFPTPGVARLITCQYFRVMSFFYRAYMTDQYRKKNINIEKKIIKRSTENENNLLSSTCTRIVKYKSYVVIKSVEKISEKKLVRSISQNAMQCVKCITANGLHERSMLMTQRRLGIDAARDSSKYDRVHIPG